MKEDEAHEISFSLQGDLGKGWGAEMPTKDIDEHRRRVNWTVTVVQKHNLGPQFRFPAEVAAIVVEHDLFVDVDASDRRVTVTLDNTDAEELELTDEEKAQKQLQNAIRTEFDLNRDGVNALADRYDSVTEISAASREELTAISGIGDRRAGDILHRHSERLKQRVQETSDERTIPVIEDENGVLRLPEEFEDSEHAPKHTADS